MPLNKKSQLLTNALLSFLGILLCLGCAVPQKPRGGPKDVVPPKLLKATPANQTHNFSSKVIKLDFDELFKLNNQYQEITISPTFEKRQPEYKVSKKSLIITLKDTLQKNTTYVINFGKAIGDLTENNIVKNLTYVFSTGPHIDSLSLSGTVTNIQTQQREKDVTVMLFNLRQDSLYFGKKKATVSTTTDTSGNWTIGNLHEGLYKLYALKESGAGDKIYDRDDELIGIPGKIINLQTDSANIKLHLFKPVPDKFKSDHRFESDGHLFFAFNRPVVKPSLKIIYPEAQATDRQNIVEFNKTNDTANLYIKNMDFDSLRMVLFENGKPLDSTSFRKGRKETYTRSVLITANSDTRSLIKQTDDLRLTANTPISSFDPSLITLNEDSTVLTNYVLKQDSANLKKFTISYKWRLNATYLLTLKEGAFIGYYGEKNRYAAKRFRIDKPDNYGALYLKIMVPDTNRLYILEFYNEQNILLQRTRAFKYNQQITFSSLLGGKYRIKVIYDDNENGRWDSGNLKTMRQPENIWVRTDPIIIKGSLDTDITIEVPPEPGP
jgi:uncharacterized protein (DUF2141 family)